MLNTYLPLGHAEHEVVRLHPAAETSAARQHIEIVSGCLQDQIASLHGEQIIDDLEAVHIQIDDLILDINIVPDKAGGLPVEGFPVVKPRETVIVHITCHLSQLLVCRQLGHPAPLVLR